MDLPNHFWTLKGKWEKGIFNSSSKSGTSVRVWASGKLYYGQIENQVPHGSGKLIWPDGKYYEGEWSQGK
jgi:hypothetical protein